MSDSGTVEPPPPVSGKNTTDADSKPADSRPTDQEQVITDTLRQGRLLDYETQMFLDLLHEDGLLILAKGLGLERLMSAFLRVYSDPSSLVLVIGTSRPEEEHWIKQLEADGCALTPRSVTADTGVQERQRVYLAGGVLFVTSRILVVDLLTDRCPADLVTGVLVYRAHTIVESAQEAFILRLFRQKNKTGFIKAFSSSPVSFTAGFCQVQRVMRNLFVRHLHLWPRFQLHVNETLKQHTPEVVEIQVKMTPLMTSIQNALLDLINVTVKEFKQLNPSLDTDDVTTETVVSRRFHKVARLRLDPVWNQLSGRTRQLISDLRTLRSLLTALPQTDCCSYYHLVAAQQSAERAMNSGWAILDAAETVFVDAKQRVFGTVEPPPAKRQKTDTSTPAILHLEDPPKWMALASVLDEIRTEMDAAKSSEKNQFPSEKVLIVATDMTACKHIKQFLIHGSQAVLWRRFQELLAPKFGQDAYLPRAVLDDSKIASSSKDKDQQTLTQMMDGEQANKDAAGVSEAKSDDLEVLVPASPLILLHPIKDPSDPFRLQRTLDLCRPGYVILYDTDMAVIRTLEVHQASCPERRMRIYTLMFSGTTEEQSYLTGLRSEKDAFQYLIDQKSSMIVPEDREGRDDSNADLARGEGTPISTEVSSRHGGGQTAPREAPRVIVDMREFRSELPALLHRRGVDVLPATIEVGDYILTPDMCVERKSISDLIGSLMSGRLYNQAQSMTRHYKQPILLIEFDQDKPFSLQGKYYLSSDMASSQVVSRLQLLTLHFPRLRLMWCPSPYASAELLHQLKEGAAEPSLAEARALTSDRAETVTEERVNPQIRDLISKLPGINSKNLYTLLNKIDSLLDLLQMSKDQLTEVLGSELNAGRLYDALHTNLTPAADDSGAAKRPGAEKSRGRGGRPRFWRGKKKS